ncbi:MAG: hypothetical protein ABSF18_03795 [Gammaproteobacteria bacterium]|jgi:hypothetical protein
MAAPIITQGPSAQSWWELEQIKRFWLRFVAQYIQLWFKPLISFLLNFTFVSSLFAAFKSFFSPQHVLTASARQDEAIKDDEEQEGESASSQGAASMLQNLDEVQELELEMRMLLQLTPLEQFYYTQFLLRKSDFLLLMIDYQLKSPHLTPDMRLQLTYNFLNVLTFRNTLENRLVHIYQMIISSLLLLHTVSDKNDFRMPRPHPVPRISEVEGHEDREENLLRLAPQPAPRLVPEAKLQPAYAPHDDNEIDLDINSYPVANVPEGYYPPVLQPAYNPEYVPGSPQIELAPEDVASAPENYQANENNPPPAYNEPTQTPVCHSWQNTINLSRVVTTPVPAPAPVFVPTLSVSA